VKGVEQKAHTDTGSVIHPSEAAAVWSPEKGYYFLVPYADGEMIPGEAVLLFAALHLLATDEEFREQLAEMVESWGKG
jgi:hypothetical protein